MKKLFLIAIVLFTTSTFAQNADKPSDTPYWNTTERILHHIIEKTPEAMRVKPIPQPSPVRDSMISAQTKTYDFAYATKAQVAIYNPSLTTADTVKISVWNAAKGDYTNNALTLVSLNYLDYGFNELDNTTIIIPANTSRKWTVAGYGVGMMKIEWKTTAGKTASNKFYISYQKIN